MKAFISSILATIMALSLTACGCSSSMGDTQMPSTTILPDILPTLDTNIPDPEVDTQMPIYTEETGITTETNSTVPGSVPEDRNK